MNIIPNTGSTIAKPPANAENPPADRSKTALETMAADFEAIFVRQMLSTMRTSSLGEGLFDGQGLEEFRDMQDSMLAKDMADKGVFGVAELLSRHVQNNGTEEHNV